MRKLTMSLMTGALLAGMLYHAAPVAAHGNIWMDEGKNITAAESKDFVPVTKFRKILVFPISRPGSHDGDPDDLTDLNDMFNKRVNKRIHKTNFLRFRSRSDAQMADKELEKNHILRPKEGLNRLLQHYPSEQERARDVYDLTGAEGFLLPHIRFAKMREDVSPATWTRVTMTSYYDEEDGPKGDRSGLGKHVWTADHLIPRMTNTLCMVDMDFTLYDTASQKKTMTLIDYYRCYNVDYDHAFNQIFKNFTGDWKRLKDDASSQAPAGAPTIGFTNLRLPASASNNEFSIKTIYYAYKDEAEDTLKNLRPDFAPGGGRYYVRGTLTNYDRGQTWNPPTASTSIYLDHTETFKWRDSKGNEHTGKRKYYKTEITDYAGCYTFWYSAAADLQVVDRRTGTVVFSHSYEAYDPERYANALRRIFGDFYRDVDKSLGSQI